MGPGSMSVAPKPFCPIGNALARLENWIPQLAVAVKVTTRE